MTHSGDSATSAPMASEPFTSEPISSSVAEAISSKRVRGELPPQDLSWDGLSYSVKLKDGSWKTLVQPTTGTARAGRVVALMGPSGAGKTTLMNSICGRIPLNAKTRLDGAAFLNDVLLRGKYKKLVSFVAQDDLILGYDTPREAMTFSHRLRYGATADEAVVAVDRTLDRLHMNKCADTVVGVPGLVKGVSGGEKKRANIGIELINNPQILFLDEPTTGLDSVTAQRVGQLLQELAHEEQRTVLCTLHTPSSELFDCFDDILLLSHGRVIYHGDREEANDYFAAAGYPVPHRMNPSEHFMTLLQGDAADKLADGWAEHLASPKAARNPSVSSCPPLDSVRGHDEALDKFAAHEPAGLLTQMWMLTLRSLRNTFRDPIGSIGRTVQTVLFAVIFAFFYFQMDNNDEGVQDRRSLLFMQAMNCCFMAILTYINVFPAERAVFLLEMTNDSYNAAVYYLSKVVSDLPMALAMPALYITIIYWIAGLAPAASAFFSALLTIIVIYNVAAALGMLVASLCPKPEVGTTIVPMILMPLMIVGGLFANTERLEPYWSWLTYISFPRYTYKALHHIEFSNLATINGQRYKTGEEVRVFDGFDGKENEWWIQVLVLVAIMVIFRIAGAISLVVQGRMQRSAMAFDRNYAKMVKASGGNSSQLTLESEE